LIVSHSSCMLYSCLLIFSFFMIVCIQ
jgi:hypothetical protein